MTCHIYDPTHPEPPGMDDQSADIIEIKVWRDGEIGLSVRDSCWDAAYLHITPDEMRTLAQRLVTVADEHERKD